MTDQKGINAVIAEGLKAATGCEVVKSNLANAPIPGYPYISFTITNTDTRKGTYAVSGNSRSIPLAQTWSLTVQSDQDNEAQIKAMEARDWLEDTGRLHLADHGIVVQGVGAITNRDTLLTVQYEYRKGFDAVLSLVSMAADQEKETIEHADIKEE